jgi:lysozyme
MQISEKGLALGIHFEGCRKRTDYGHFKPYYCPAGILTIGRGHTNAHGRSFNAGSVWTQEECDAEFSSDMGIAAAALERLVKVPLQQYEYDALVNFVHNCGEGALAGSTILRRLNAGDRDGAAAAFLLWNKHRDPKTGNLVESPGLTRRRASESLMFKGIQDDNYDGKPDTLLTSKAEEGEMPQKVEAPVVAPMSDSRIAKAGQATSAVGGGYLLDGIWKAFSEVPSKIQDLLLLPIKHPGILVGILLIVIGYSVYKWRFQMKLEKGV